MSTIRNVGNPNALGIITFKIFCLPAAEAGGGGREGKGKGRRQHTHVRSQTPLLSSNVNWAATREMGAAQVHAFWARVGGGPFSTLGTRWNSSGSRKNCPPHVCACCCCCCLFPYHFPLCDSNKVFLGIQTDQFDALPSVYRKKRISPISAAMKQKSGKSTKK